MKNSVGQTQLWQTKLQELPLEVDANTSWQKMQAMLDANMPASAPIALATKPSNFSALVKIAAIIIAVAALFYAGYYLFTRQQNKVIKPADNMARPGAVIAGTNKSAGYAAANPSSAPNKNNSNAAIPDSGQNAASANNSAARSNNKTVGGSPINKPAAANHTDRSGGSAADNSASNNKTNTGSIKPNEKSTATRANIAQNKGALSRLRGGANHSNVMGLLPANTFTKNNLPPSAHHNSATGNAAQTSRKRVAGANNTSNSGYPLSRNSRTGNSLSNTRGGNGKPSNPNAKRRKNLAGNAGKANAGDNNNSGNNSSTAPSGGVIPPSNLTTRAFSGVVNSPSSPAKRGDTSAQKGNLAGAAGLKPANAIANNKPQAPKPAAKDKTKTGRNSTFVLGMSAGANTGGSNSTGVYYGLAGSYYFSPKLGLSIGAKVLQKTITGAYSNSNYKYTTLFNDTGKIINHVADKLTVKSSGKIYTVDIPVMATYRATNWLSFKAGPVISIPIKVGAFKTTLSPFKNPADSLKADTAIRTAAAGSALRRTLNFSLQGGVSINFNRFYIDASYLQGLSPYTISSSLGSAKTYYHSVQVGVGFYIFRSKK